MPYDPSEFETNRDEEQFDQPSETEQVVDQFVDDLIATPPAVDEPDDDAYMNNVRERHEVSSHYIQLLEAPLFGEQTPPARIVEREVRKYVRERLEILLGIRTERAAPPPPESVFSDEDVLGIKVLLANMRQKGMLAAASAAPTPPSPPAVRVAPAPPPRVAPTVTVRTAIPVPAIVQRQPPTTPAPQPAAASAATPVKQKRAAKQTTKKVVREYDGKEVTVHRVQRPSDAVPFPSSDAALSAATELAATIQTMNTGTAPGGGLDLGSLAQVATLKHR